MYDDFSLDAAAGVATVRLINTGWAGYLQQACARLKAIGSLHRADGTDALLKRLRRTRPSTFHHSMRAARFARATGRAFGFDDTRLKQLAYTAMLHDVGKLLVPQVVLNRPRRPTRAEQFILHMHPSFGAMLASYFNLPPELRVRTQHHHERWDGKGYPHKLGGEAIPLMARIVQVADTYDAMVAVRPYRAPLSHEAAITELREHRDKQFDPRVIEAFIDTFPPSLKST